MAHRLFIPVYVAKQALFRIKDHVIVRAVAVDEPMGPRRLICAGSNPNSSRYQKNGSKLKIEITLVACVIEFTLNSLFGSFS